MAHGNDGLHQPTHVQMSLKQDCEPAEQAAASGSAAPISLETRFDVVYREHCDFVWRSLRRLGLAEAELPDSERPLDSLNQFEHWWHNPVELILMLFGFANAGVVLGSAALPTGLVSVGLLVGKPVGITLLTLLAVKAFKLEMPSGMNFRDVVVLGFMAGIGFTVALFVSTVAFPPGTTLDAAKMGALLSVSAAILSFIAAKVLRTQKVV